MKKLFVSLLLPAALCCGAPAAATAQDIPDDGKTPELNKARLPPPYTAEEKLYALSRFWMEARRNFVYMDQMGTARWDSLYRSYIQPVLESRDDNEFLHLLCRFCAALKDGHTYLNIQSYRYEPFSTLNYFSGGWGLNTFVAGRHVYVSGVARAKRKIVPPGSELVAIDGRDVQDCIAEEMKETFASTDEVRYAVAASMLLHGERYTSRVATFRRPDGSTVDVALRNEYVNGYGEMEWDRLPGVPCNWQRAEFALEWLRGDVAYLKIGTFQGNGVLEKFYAALPEVKQRARKVIIDLRNNGGGSSGTSTRIMSHFLAGDTFCDQEWSTRTYNAAYAAWGADVQPADTVGNPTLRAYYQNYHDQATTEPKASWKTYPADRMRLVVPTAILINRNTASACENLLVMADGQPNITIIGQPSNGSTGQPITVQLLPDLQGYICTKKDTYPGGRVFVGKGIEPDIYVPLTLEDLTEKEDRVLKTAVEFLRKAR